jgi:hypothetical protein
MKRYTIVNNQLGKTFIFECEGDLNSFFKGRLPDEYKDATITEEDISAEVAARQTAIQSHLAAKNALELEVKALKGKTTLTAVEVAKAVRLWIMERYGQ